MLMCASTTSSSSRVGLDGQIKRGFPHELKMTETNPMPSVSMSASLPLTLIEQVQKGLYQATDWRERGGARAFLFAGQRRAHPLIYVYVYKTHGARSNDNKGDIDFCPTATVVVVVAAASLPIFSA